MFKWYPPIDASPFKRPPPNVPKLSPDFLVRPSAWMKHRRGLLFDLDPDGGVVGGTFVLPDMAV